MWKRIGRGMAGQNSQFKYHNNALQLPRRAHKATVEVITQSTVKLTGWRRTISNPTQQTTHHNTPRVCNIINTVPTGHEHELVNSITLGTAIAVSDGSFSMDKQKL